MLILSGRLLPYHGKGWWKKMAVEMWTQVSAAYKLAAHYGHLWGKINPLMVQLATEDADQDIEAGVSFEVAIEEMCAEIARHASGYQTPGLPGGIDSPEFEGRVITHCTLTGRLEWKILPNGVVKFTVHREVHGPVLEIVAAPDCDSKSYRIVETKSHYGCYARHVAAALEALRALNEPIFDTSTEEEEEEEGN